ncbi:hypothetical protein CYMTET_37867, partial [Cymbomonas tetramitiformis]
MDHCLSGVMDIIAAEVAIWNKEVEEKSQKVQLELDKLRKEVSLSRASLERRIQMALQKRRSSDACSSSSSEITSREGWTERQEGTVRGCKGAPEEKKDAERPEARIRSHREEASLETHENVKGDMNPLENIAAAVETLTEEDSSCLLGIQDDLANPIKTGFDDIPASDLIEALHDIPKMTVKMEGKRWGYVKKYVENQRTSQGKLTRTATLRDLEQLKLASKEDDVDEDGIVHSTLARVLGISSAPELKALFSGERRLQEPGQSRPGQANQQATTSGGLSSAAAVNKVFPSARVLSDKLTGTSGGNVTAPHGQDHQQPQDPAQTLIRPLRRMLTRKPTRKSQKPNLSLMDRAAEYIEEMKAEDTQDQAEPTKFWAFFVINPENRHRQNWDLLLIVCLLNTAYLIPFRLSFIAQNEASLGILVFDWITDIIFMLDVFVNFVTSVEDNGGQMIREPKEIALRYLRGWFFIDLIAATPWDWFFGQGTGGPSMTRVTRLFKVARLMKLLRMLRMLRIVKILIKMAQMERNLKHPGLLRFIKMVFFITAIVHWFACLAHTIASNYEDKGHQTTDFSFGYSRLDQFFMGLWPPATTPPHSGSLMVRGAAALEGSGLLQPHTAAPVAEAMVLFTLCVFWVGSSLLISAFGSAVALISEIDAAEAEQRIKVDKVLAYMRRLQVPKQLRARVLDYYDLFYAHTHGIDGQTFMKDLPRHLRQEMAIFLNRGVLEQMPLFWDCSVPFLVAVLMYLKLNVALEGDLIITEGEIGNEMYIILRGKVQVRKEGKRIGTLTRSDFFGEGVLTS